MKFIKYIIRKVIAHFISGKVEPMKVAESQIKIVATHGFMAFRDPEFRRLIDFDKQSKVEQDRLFNELVATAIILLEALYINKLPDIKEQKQAYWREVEDCLEPAFKEYLKSIGIPDQYVGMWQQVIDQRWEEYLENKNYTREEFLDELGSKPKHGEFVRDMAVIIETIKITSGLHLTRRRAKPKDPIFNYMQLWLIRLSNRLYDEIGW